MAQKNARPSIDSLFRALMLIPSMQAVTFLRVHDVQLFHQRASQKPNKRIWWRGVCVCVCAQEQNRTFNLHMQYRVRKYLRCQPACSQRGARSIIFYSFSLSRYPAPSTLFTLQRTRCSRPCVEFIVKERAVLHLGNIWQSRRKKVIQFKKKRKEKKSKFWDSATSLSVTGGGREKSWSRIWIQTTYRSRKKCASFFINFWLWNSWCKYFITFKYIPSYSVSQRASERLLKTLLLALLAENIGLKLGGNYTLVFL